MNIRYILWPVNLDGQNSASFFRPPPHLIRLWIVLPVIKIKRTKTDQINFDSLFPVPMKTDDAEWEWLRCDSIQLLWSIVHDYRTVDKLILNDHRSKQQKTLSSLMVRHDENIFLIQAGYSIMWTKTSRFLPTNVIVLSIPIYYAPQFDFYHFYKYCGKSNFSAQAIPLQQKMAAKKWHNDHTCSDLLTFFPSLLLNSCWLPTHNLLHLRECMEFFWFFCCQFLVHHHLEQDKFQQHQWSFSDSSP